jgi:hypothetical protein
MTDASLQALGVLRSTENLQWYVVPLLIIVLYVYITEIENKNWGVLLLGIYSFANGWILEIVNALILHFTKYAALWSTPGNSAFVIYVGWNIEIFVLAAVGGILVLKTLPKDKDMKILGIPNRIFIPVFWAVFAVGIEILLNRSGILVWEYKYWSWPNIYFIVIWWTIPYFGLARMHDNLPMKTKKRLAVAFPVIAVAMHIVFATILGWV